ncbi:hypothetical protein [Novipirellula artificiosorum]|uniref:Uncharacterized protein n=1 Tax=Novipirellula artificiosorum TaxID=2528016 RepID=A0A5C6CWT9_9BACT|nr:hypothetical protein [Novipirellula artificiosorum]TWU28027.1 hypothetical protein Poly41_69230 [Novipirellula artificiosorum]
MIIIRKPTFLIAMLSFVLISMGESRADLIVTWTDTGSNLTLSVTGSWSQWNASTAPTQTNTLTFPGGSEFDLSRGNIPSSPGAGAFAFIDQNAGGSGSISGPTVNFGTSLPATGYFLRHTSLGGFMILEADTPTTTIDPSRHQ